MPVELPASGGSVSSDEARAALSRILQSATFAHSPQLQRLLTFLVEQTLSGHTDRLKEYVIGLEVFERPDSFDPRLDSLVRVEARRLRSTLAIYYEKEGARDPVAIDLPKGRYVPSFRPARSGPPAGEPDAEPVTPEPGGVLDKDMASPARKLPRFRMATSVFIVLTAVAGVLGVSWLFRSTPARALTERDGVILAGFTNSTNEPDFDEALKQGLASGLEQSPFLNLVSDRRVGQVLALMGRTPSDRLSSEQSRDLCLRAGARVLVSGSIDRLGSRYVVGLTATDCESGDDLAHVQEEASRKEDVLRALGSAARSLRGRLGESVASIKRFGVTVEEATTSSLEALKAYSLGRSTGREKGSPADIPFYKRALEIDPDFAAAHAAIGVSYVNLGQTSLAREHFSLAYQHRDRVSERERFRVSAYYFQAVTGEVEQAAEIYEVWAQAYPREFAPRANLALVHLWFGDYERALAETKEAQQLEPANVLGYTNLAAILMKLGRPDEARRALDQAAERGLSGKLLRLNLSYLAFLQGDGAAVERRLEPASGNSGEDAQLLSLASDTEAYFGRMEKAHALTARAADAAVRAGERESAALWLLNAALREAEFGHGRAAVRLVADALARSDGRDEITLAALASARAGDAGAAERLTAKLVNAYPLNTVISGYWAPTIRAATDLARHAPAAAVQELDRVAGHELGSPPPFGLATLYPVYLRGIADLSLVRPAEAAKEFQRVLDRPGLVLNFPLHALAHLQLARALRLSGDLAASQRCYDTFLALWKDADPTLALLTQARNERRDLLSRASGPVSR